MQAFGLRQLRESSRFDLRMFLTRRRNSSFSRVIPCGGRDRDFEAVRPHARTHTISVVVLLPAKDSPYIEVVAERIDKLIGSLQEIIDDAAMASWGMRGSPNLSTRTPHSRSIGTPVYRPPAC